jgi:hypothetical protein
LRIKKEYGSTTADLPPKSSGNYANMPYGIEGMMSSFGNTSRATGSPSGRPASISHTFDMGPTSIRSEYLIIQYLFLGDIRLDYVPFHVILEEDQRRAAKS